MVKANICVLVSGGGTNLQALIDAQNSEIIKSGKISLVISNKKDVYALTRAKENNIPHFVVENKGKSQEEFEKELEKYLEEYNIDLIVLAGFLAILSPEFTKKHENAIINVHPSLIPAFCGKGFYGLKVHEEALKYGVKVTGATVHFVNEIPDGGQIIMQRAVSINKRDTAESLQRRVMEKAEWKILPLSTELVCKNILKRK